MPWKDAEKRRTYEAARHQRKKDDPQYRARRRANKRKFYQAHSDEIREKIRSYPSYWASASRSRPEMREITFVNRHGSDVQSWWSRAWSEQRGHCYLCLRAMDPDDAVVEHDHRCCPAGSSCQACRRGLAHSRCNIAIGMAGDDPAILRTIADRLEQAKKLITIPQPPPTLFDDVA